MAKPMSLAAARKALSPLRDRAPADAQELQEMRSVLRRLPDDIDDELVAACLAHELRAGPYIGDSVSALLRGVPVRGVPSNPKRWARAVVIGTRLVPEQAWARAYAAGVPGDESQWAEHLVAVDEARFLSITFWNDKMWRAADRIATIQRLASRPGVVIGMRAAAPDLPRTRFEGACWILAADGHPESMVHVEAYVAENERTPSALDWLALDFAPLLTSEWAAPLGARLVASREARILASPGRALLDELELGEVPLRFKVGLFAESGMPRVRLWVDTTRSPWFDARWNWDELVSWKRSPPETPPLEQLRAFLAACVADGKGEFKTWELVTSLRGDAKARLIAFLGRELEALEGPRPASAPLKSWRGLP